jgi:hypothetical protein
VVDVPTFEEFRSMPAAEIAPHAPRTVVFAGGGTRRAAVLAGIPVDSFSERLAEFSMHAFTETAGHFFALGVRHLFGVAFFSKQFAERGPHRAYMLEGTRYALGEIALPQYRARGWRARLVGYEQVPELAGLAAEFIRGTPADAPHTIWWTATASAEAVWERLIALAQGATTRAELTRRYFGEEVPPADLLLGFGKPFISPELIPPLLLGGETHTYYYQRPGYRLDEAEIRALLYDYRYLRRTWVADKSGRYRNIQAQRTFWQRNPVLGLGRRVGPFWYPALDAASTTPSTGAEI